MSWSEAFSNNLDVTAAEVLRDAAGMAWARLASALHAFLERHVSGNARFVRIAALDQVHIGSAARVKHVLVSCLYGREGGWPALWRLRALLTPSEGAVKPRSQARWSMR